jgi:3-isopropylmalate/(R)-2-methylmalate dehydratase small subunit
VRRFSAVSGRAVPIDRENVDTDQIIPTRHLKRIERDGYGPFAFEAWRRDPEFALNDPAYQGASIMLTRSNFGSGSSREHAVWALDGLGIEVLIGVSFADIFKNNCFQNGILTVELSGGDIDHLMGIARKTPQTEIVVDLPGQTVEVVGNGWKRSFQIDPFSKYRLLRGLDDISMTLQYVSDIEAYEQRRDNASLPSTEVSPQTNVRWRPT